MTNERATTHPDPVTLAAFAEGRLNGADVTAIVEHIDRCDDCMSEVALAMSAHSENEIADRGSQVAGAEREATRDPRSAPPKWLFALAAAVVLAVVALTVMRDAIPFGRSPMRRLVALAPKTERVIEPRLSGGFGWAEYAGAHRATREETNATKLKLAGAAGELVERAERDPDPENQHAAGVAMVLVENPIDAVTRLEAVAAKSQDANIWSDLAAARYAAASQYGRASLYPLALAAADSALRIDPKLAEALFNRALILERIGLAEEARHAWQRYLEIDPSSPWANEARARMAALPVSTRSSQFDRDRPKLELAAERGDTSAVRSYVDAHRDRARAFVEAEYLGQWGEAVQRKDAPAATRWLTISRAIANAVAQLSGDSLAREAVRAIDQASESDRQIIAAAHVAYRRGRIAYSRREHDAAERDLRQAAESFDAAHDPMALSARYYAAGVRLARNDTIAARADLERARAEADAHPNFLNLGAHVRWELSRALMLDDDWSGAVPVLTEGASMFQRSGERASEAFVESLLARALASMGRADDAWLARMRAFSALSAEGENDLLATSVDAAMHAELLSGRNDAALALSTLALAIARSGAQPQLVLYASVNEAMLQAMTGHAADALHTARQAEETARSTTDPALRARQLADVAAASGAALAATDPRAAIASLTRTIEFYKRNDLPVGLPEPLLLRARCAVRTGDTNAALRDLEEGIAVVERHRTETSAGASVLDADHALFTDAIRLSLDRNDPAAAFAFTERLRGGSITRAELQRRLAGSGAVVLEIVCIPDELVLFAISENDTVVARRRQSRETLASLAGRSLEEDTTTAAAALYDALIRPVDAVLARAREVVIVPDPQLQSVPFAALYDDQTHRHLIERFAISVASNAASLQPEVAGPPAPAIAAIALPSAGATESFALPEAEREIGEITSLYRRAEAIHAEGATLATLKGAAARADVLHIAGHTEVQPGGGEQALLLAGKSANAIERVSSKTILAATPIRSRIVVLAACETLRPPQSAATSAPSLAQAFISAGARDVVGTLAPIGDRDARLLFTALHRRVANGERVADALRAAQQEAIALDANTLEAKPGGRRAWRAIALLTRTIPTPMQGKEGSTWPHNP